MYVLYRGHVGWWGGGDRDFVPHSPTQHAQIILLNPLYESGR